MIMQWAGCPDEQIIFDFDTSEKRNLKPNYLTDEEVKMLNEHLGDMDITLARMTIILENIGMRIIECCMLKQGCTRIGINNQHIIKYYQYKTKKDNIVPISEEVYLTIEAASNYAQNTFNEFKYVFEFNWKPLW
jgi:integrase